MAFRALGGGISGNAIILFGVFAVVLVTICSIRMHRARKQADEKMENTLPGTTIVSPRPYFEPYRYQPPAPAANVIDTNMLSYQNDTTTTGAGVLPSYAAPSVSLPSYPALVHVVTISDAVETNRNSPPLSTLPQASSGVAVQSSQATPAVSAP
ncbi:hypothetical protein BGZ47_003829 [Haplosporangium gracile]|nr:hypothetical protein BGZ47_003829 [Haplosporangium gracile]